MCDGWPGRDRFRIYYGPVHLPASASLRQPPPPSRRFFLFYYFVLTYLFSAVLSNRNGDAIYLGRGVPFLALSSPAINEAGKSIINGARLFSVSDGDLTRKCMSISAVVAPLQLLE